METKNLFGEGNCQKCHARNKSMRKTTHNLTRQHQDVDKAITGGSSESSGGPFTVEEDCPK